MDFKMVGLGCLGLVVALLGGVGMFGCAVVQKTVELKQENNSCDEGWSQV